MKRLLAAAAVLATLAQAAAAGEITLFTDSDFRGARLSIDRDAYNLADMGFNDRASSLVVRSGVWQVCENKDFGGYCAEFGPGEYRELPRFNDRISSVREISRGRGGDDRRGGPGWRGERDDRRDDRRDERGGRGDAVQLFSGQRFEGPAVSLSGDVRELNDVGFNDRAGSIVIHEGRWEFCEHGDFRGQCVVFGPGRYPFLEGMNNRISSMRRVR
ncbi:beta/gamma crystallin-related protein [Massilia aerilata]|uniref:Beta/gamma crystallin-related protein n=1 Tax=Massilia aerilata TaxID=453817 RepID=A0ABW0S7M7_9BURK